MRHVIDFLVQLILGITGAIGMAVVLAGAWAVAGGCAIWGGAWCWKWWRARLPGRRDKGSD
jgi:hypothetical protein